MNLTRKSKMYAAGAVGAVVLAAAGGLAFAQNVVERENDAVTDLSAAKIGIVDAIASAQAHAGGKAAKAELESERGKVVFHIEVVTPAPKVFDVTVDAVDGKVLSSQEDRGDRGHDEKD